MSMKHPFAENGRRLRQFAVFNVVGLINTAADFAVFALLQLTALGYLADQTLSYTAGATCSFVLNRRWTFRRGARPDAAELLRFAAVNLSSLGVSLLTMFAFHDSLGLPLPASKIITVAATLTVNFTGMKLWVFRAKRPDISA